MAKNRNGMGSIRERADGRFEGRYTGPDGRQHSVFGKTSKECTTKLKAALAAVDSGSWTQPNKMTVAQWIDLWLDKYCVTVRPSTLRNYTSKMAHVRQSIGNIKLTSLSVVHLRQLYANICKYLAQTTCREIMIIFSSSLNDAVRDKLIPENPAKTMNLGKARPAKEMHIVDRPQFAAFVSAARETPYANELIFLLLTGLRIGELLGLKWNNVDLDKGTMRIDRQLVLIDGKYTLAETKNGEARTINLTPEAVSLLKNQKIRQLEARVKAGKLWTDCGFTFTNAYGDHLLFVTIGKYVRRAGAAIGISALHPHDLRHSYAVAALRSGMSVKAVQHNLGHASAAMTLDVYAKYTDDTGLEATRLMSVYFSGVLGSN